MTEQISVEQRDKDRLDEAMAEFDRLSAKGSLEARNYFCETVGKLLSEYRVLEKENETWCDNATEKEANAARTAEPSLSGQFSKLVRDAINARVDEWMAGVGKRIEKAEQNAAEAKTTADRLLTGFMSHEGRISKLEPGEVPVPGIDDGDSETG
jgi:hypothetical protein